MLGNGAAIIGVKRTTIIRSTIRKVRQQASPVVSIEVAAGIILRSFAVFHTAVTVNKANAMILEASDWLWSFRTEKN